MTTATVGALIWLLIVGILVLAALGFITWLAAIIISVVAFFLGLFLIV